MNGSGSVERITFHKDVFLVHEPSGTNHEIQTSAVKGIEALPIDHVCQLFTEGRASLHVRDFGTEGNPVYNVSAVLKLLGGRGITPANVDSYRVDKTVASMRTGMAAIRTAAANRAPAAVASASASRPLTAAATAVSATGVSSAPSPLRPSPAVEHRSTPAATPSRVGVNLTTTSRTSSSPTRTAGGSLPPSAPSVSGPAARTAPSRVGFNLTSGRAPAAPTRSSDASSATSRTSDQPLEERVATLQRDVAETRARLDALQRAEDEHKSGGSAGEKCQPSHAERACRTGAIVIGSSVGDVLGAAGGQKQLGRILGGIVGDYAADAVCNPDNYPSSIHPVLKEAAIRESGATEGVYDHSDTSTRPSSSGYGSTILRSGGTSHSVTGYARSYTYIPSERDRTLSAVSNATGHGLPGSTITRSRDSHDRDSSSGNTFSYNREVGGFIIPAGDRGSSDFDRGSSSGDCTIA